MQKRFFVLLFLFAFVTINIVGCNMPLPTCSTESLQQVTLNSPSMMSVVDSLNPTLQWTYPSTECTPEGYAITLWEGPVLVTNIGGGTGNPNTSWGPGSPLQPGKQYRWKVAPINGTTLGPASETNVFFTGPTCTDAGLIPPTMLEPADGAIFNETTDLLWWDYTAGCTPTGYQLDVATDPTFASGMYPSGIIDIPLTRAQLGDPPLLECETYYWRVAARNGATVGPYSPTRSFGVDPNGTCTADVPPESASIGGIVWHDLCSIPDGPLPDPLSAGCVVDGSGSARANGIREEGEPGIAGIQVDLYYGKCDWPNTPSDASVLTDANGHYLFDGLTSFGFYCVSINPTASPNDSILIPGEWTYPDTITDESLYGGEYSGIAYQAFGGVNPNVNIDIIDFGWDYQFLPAFNDPTATPVSDNLTPNIPNFVDDSGFNTPFPQFSFDKNAFCRKGPGINYSDITAIPKGDVVDVLGVNADRQWLFINWAKFDAKCWVAFNTGHLITGDLLNVLVMTPPPAPPTQVPQPTTVPTQTPIKP